MMSNLFIMMAELLAHEGRIKGRLVEGNNR